MPTVANAIFEHIKPYANTVYFVPGGGAMYLVDALGKSGLRHVSAMNEHGAGTMALGHAMQTDGLGVCLVTSGPGSTNAITACASAWTDSIPVLFISGQARSDTLGTPHGLRTRGVQEVDIVRMVKPVTKMSYQPMTSGVDCIMALDKMIDACLTGRRGPCWLAVPMDIQGMNYAE